MLNSPLFTDALLMMWGWAPGWGWDYPYAYAGYPYCTLHWLLVNPFLCHLYGPIRVCRSRRAHRSLTGMISTVSCTSSPRP
jgi:hypothetical protein